MDGLTVGRVVHYVNSDMVHKAAIVVGVVNQKEGVVDLVVFDPEYDRPATNIRYIRYQDTHTAHSWHWIERA